MKNTLVDKLKVALGRKLSEKQMENVPHKSERVTNTLASGKIIYRTSLAKLPSGDFSRTRETFLEQLSADASHSSRILHCVYAPIKTVVETYDSQGMVREKTTTYHVLYGGTQVKKRNFEPSGSFLGEFK